VQARSDPAHARHPGGWLAAAVEVALFALALVLAAKLGRLTDWDNQQRYLALRTPYWPFYVLRVEAPLWTSRVLFPVAAFALATISVRGWLRGEGNRAAALVGVVVAAWLFELTLAVAHLGIVDALGDTFQRPGMEYWQDAVLVGKGFLRRFPEVGALSIHGSTHPPGLALLLAGLQKLGFTGARDAELVCSTVGAATAVPLYGAARRLAGEAVARAAVALFLFACSLSAFAVLSMDVVTMFLATTALYGLARALDGERWGGVILGAGLFAASMCNFVALVLPLGFVLLLASRWGDRRRALAPLALAVAVFFGAYLLLWAACGYRPFHVYRVCSQMLRGSMDQLRPRGGSLLGSPLAYLGALGLPLGAAAVRAIGGAWLRLHRRQDVATALLVLAGAAPWLLGAALGKPRGEVEHAYLLFVPMTVIATATALRRWYHRGERWILRMALPLLAAQSILVEVYLSTYW